MAHRDLAPGDVLGRYELLLCVARGGMARVWAARLHGSRGFRKLVAIKTILSGALDDSRLEQMLLEEATLVAAIQHPNVGATLELGEQDGTLYLVMEWIDGESLHYIERRMAEQGQPAPLEVGASIVLQACRGLHAAHEQTDEQGRPLGIVHRDVSPHNILISYAGTTKLVDFGVAKASSRQVELTQAGELKGKLSYLAPELMRGSPIDRRADIFSLGVVLYLVTTGRHPFRGDSPAETLRNICAPKPVMPPSAIIEDYPPELAAVVLKALKKAPEDRWQTAQEMGEALEQAMSDSVEARREARVAEFMREQFGPRGVERRKSITAAGDELDRQRAAQGFEPSGSQGSLRAVSFDQSVSMTGLGPAPPAAPPPAEVAPDSSPPAELLFAPRRKRVLVAGASAALVLGVFLAVGLLGRSHSEAGDAVIETVPAAAPVPVERPEPRLALDPAPPAPRDDGGDAGATAEAGRDDEKSGEAKKSARRKAAKASSGKKERRRAVRVRAAPAPEQAAKDVEPQAEPSARPTPPPVVRKQSVDPWDPDTYGGRH